MPQAIPMPAEPADAAIIRAYQRIVLLHDLLRRAVEDAPDLITFEDQVVHAMIDDCYRAATALEPLLEWNGGYPERRTPESAGAPA